MLRSRNRPPQAATVSLRWRMIASSPGKKTARSPDTGLWSLISDHFLQLLLLQNRVEISQHLRRVPLLSADQLPRNLSVPVDHISFGYQRSPVTQRNFGLVVLRLWVSPGRKHD